MDGLGHFWGEGLFGFCEGAIEVKDDEGFCHGVFERSFFASETTSGLVRLNHQPECFGMFILAFGKTSFSMENLVWFGK